APRAIAGDEPLSRAGQAGMKTDLKPSPAAQVECYDTLMVIVPDRLSEIASKGEIVPRYYNPGNLFRHVHLVMTNDDHVAPEQVRAMVGDAEVTVHSFASGAHTFVRTAGWRPFLLRRWADPIVDLARRVRPALVRCHGNDLNAFAASEIKRRLGIPYVV